MKRCGVVMSERVKKRKKLKFTKGPDGMKPWRPLGTTSAALGRSLERAFVKS